jgi:hypothetical protein
VPFEKLYGVTPLVIRSTSGEELCVIEGFFRSDTRVDADLYVLHNGEAQKISGMGAGRSGGEVGGLFISRLKIRLAATTFQTANGSMSVLVGRGHRSASTVFHPLEYEPFEPRFKRTLSGRVPVNKDFVVYASGDREPRIMWGMDIDRFAAENTRGNFLVLTLAQRR